MKDVFDAADVFAEMERAAQKSCYSSPYEAEKAQRIAEQRRAEKEARNPPEQTEDEDEDEEEG